RRIWLSRSETSANSVPANTPPSRMNSRTSPMLPHVSASIRCPDVDSSSPDLNGRERTGSRHGSFQRPRRRACASLGVGASGVREGLADPLLRDGHRGAELLGEEAHPQLLQL